MSNVSGRRDEINERRHDEAFMGRLRQRMTEDAALMDRLRDGECREARLVESRGGGGVLVYECECGARLTRTRKQPATRSRPTSSSPDSAEGGEQRG